MSKESIHETHMGGPQFDENQRRQAMDLIENVSWVDLDAHIRSFEMILALVLEATRNAFVAAEWDASFDDEFRSADRIAELDAEERLAFIAHLVYTAALDYGVDPDAPSSRTPEGVPVLPRDLGYDDGIGPLVHGLNDIVHGLSPSAA